MGPARFVPPHPWAIPRNGRAFYRSVQVLSEPLNKAANLPPAEMITGQ